MPKILLVDDDPEVLSSLKRALRKEPYEFVTATSGKEALEILEEDAFDLIVSDEMMPGMKGSEFLKECRQLYPDIVRIMLTGATNVESAMNAIYDGWVYQYLHKPVKAADLAAVIHNALLLKSLRMDGESPHLVMSTEAQNELLEEYDAGQSKTAVQALTSDEIVDKIRGLVESPEFSDNPRAALNRIKALLKD